MQAIRDDRQRKSEAARSRQLERQLAALPADLRQRVLATLEIPEAARTSEHNELLAEHAGVLTTPVEELKKLDPQLQSECEQLDHQIKQLEGQSLPEPRIRALWSRGDPSPTYVLRRGNYLTPGKLVEPGVPAVLSAERPSFLVSRPWENAPSTGRRLAFARWLTQPDHPLTAA